MSLNPLDTSGFPPRWFCGPAWSDEPAWGWIHIVSDIIIWLSYLSIPAVLLFAARKRGDIPVKGIVGLFAAFVVACGFTHLIEAIIFWWPVYRLAAVAKVITAAVSVATVVALVRVFPLALKLRSPAQLEHELEAQQTQLSSINRVLGVDPGDLEGLERFAFERTQLRLALEGGRMGAWFWDIQSNRVDSSDEQAELLKLSLDELTTVDAFLDRVHPNDLPALQESLDRAIKDEGVYDHRFRFRNGDDEEVWLGGRGQVLRDKAGEPRVLVGVNWDATVDQQIRAELERQRSFADAASRSKGEFLANVSHEIRTPLTAILGCADLLFTKVRDEEASHLLETIRRQGTLLQRLLNDVLDISKIEAGELSVRTEPVDLRQIAADVRSLMDPLASEKSLELRTSIDPALPEQLTTDPVRVRQILLNLVSNGIKFTEKGSVDVQIQNAQEDGETIAVTIMVSDTGPGIPGDQIGRLFSPFEQLDTSNTRTVGGTGLGLTIVDRLVELLGGVMEVESDVGVGTTFIIRLPVGMPDQPATAVGDNESQDASQAVKRMQLPISLLVAEDTDALQFVLQKTLEPIVEAITFVGNGEEAVNAVRAAEIRNDQFDAILMDIQMPVMDGLDATRLLREEGYEVPIFALTAAAMSDDTQRSLAAGCSGHLVKPIDQRSLYDALASCVKDA